MKAMELNDIFFGFLVTILFAIGIAVFIGPLFFKEPISFMIQFMPLAIIILVRIMIAKIGAFKRSFIWFLTGAIVVAFFTLSRGNDFNILVACAFGLSLIAIDLLFDRRSIRENENG